MFEITIVDMMDKLQDILIGIGLKASEARVLIILLQEGSLRVRDIGRKVRINRTTAYGILKGLLKKGLISSISRYGITEYQSIEPPLLLQYIDRKKAVLERSKEEVVKILPQIKQIRENRNIFPKIHFFEGEEGIKQAYEDTLENNEGKQLLNLTGADAIYNNMGLEWWGYYWKKRTRLGIQCEVIAPNTKWAKVMKKQDSEFKRVTRFIPGEYSFGTEINIYDNKIAIFSFSKEKPLAVIIEDEVITDTLKILFQYIKNTIR